MVFFPPVSQTNSLNTPLSSLTRATWPPHLILLDFITHAILREEYKSFSSSLCNLLQSPVTSSLLGPNILFSTISLLYFSTCLEHCCVHHQKVKMYYTASIIVTLFRWPLGAQVDLLMRSTIVLNIRRPNCIIQHLVSSQSVGGRSVRRTIPDAV